MISDAVTSSIVVIAALLFAASIRAPSPTTARPGWLVWAGSLLFVVALTTAALRYLAG